MNPKEKDEIITIFKGLVEAEFHFSGKLAMSIITDHLDFMKEFVKKETLQNKGKTS